MSTATIAKPQAKQPGKGGRRMSLPYSCWSSRVCWC